MFFENDIFAAVALTAPKGVLANGVKTSVVLSWEPVSKADGYEIYEKTGEGSYALAAVTEKTTKVLTEKTRGITYTYKVRAYKKGKGKTLCGKYSKAFSTQIAKNAITTLQNFLTTAMTPVGNTMYIWGGGWNKADNGAGGDGLRIGVNPTWRKFASKQKASYNYRKYRYKRGYGLDCSGFTGWTLYNVMNTNKGIASRGYVTNARKIALACSNRGWGSYTKASNVKNYKAGDIMSSPTHVYIVIGACDDGSVVLVHSSPCGVQLSGTVSRKGKTNSQAVKIAKEYMKKNHPSWYGRYPKNVRDKTYLTKFNQFRWSIGEDNTMEDPDGLRKMNVREVLELIG